MISVRKNNPTLERGIQIVRQADSKPGIFAVVRVNPESREEMLALFNNSSEAKSAKQQVQASEIFDEAAVALVRALELAGFFPFEPPRQRSEQPAPPPPMAVALPPPSEQQLQKKKKKLLNGIGKLIRGTTAGVVNVLALTGTIIAPNQATFYGAIVSGGVAVSTLFAGIGDLRGESFSMLSRTT